jgi:hypothetical protein
MLATPSTRFQSTNSPAARLEALEEAGVYGRIAERLADEHPLWRIEQAIQYMRAAEARIGRRLSPNWLVHCLDGNRIPLSLLARRSRPARFTQDRRMDRALTAKGRQYIETVRCAIKELDFWQWAFLVHEAIASTEYDFYRRLFFENPNRSNWLLCAKVYEVSRRIDLASPSFAQFVERVMRYTTGEEIEQLCRG